MICPNGYTSDGFCRSRASVQHQDAFEPRLHGRHQESCEGGDSALIPDGQATFTPQLKENKIILFQFQDHRVGGAASGIFTLMVDCDQVFTVLLHPCVQIITVSDVPGDPEVIESAHRSCEPTCGWRGQVADSSQTPNYSSFNSHIRTAVVQR